MSIPAHGTVRTYDSVEQAHAAMLLDPALSWKAKGMLAVLMAFPDGVAPSVTALKSYARDGQHATRATMRELIEAGYVTREDVHREDGTMGGVVYRIDWARLA